MRYVLWGYSLIRGQEHPTIKSLAIPIQPPFSTPRMQLIEGLASALTKSRPSCSSSSYVAIAASRTTVPPQ